MNKLCNEIYCDMDGVLVDFERGASQLLGKDWNSFKGEVSQAERDKITFESEDFWENLPPMPDFQQLWDFISPNNPNILTAYPYRHTGKVAESLCKDGKWKWNLKYTFTPRDKFHVVLRSDKQLYATGICTHNRVIPNVLIDDREENIKEWDKNRGIGILHKNAEDTIQQLKQLGYV
jgi:hypothetical protein